MKERPIIFGAEMVRAILDGRKTQTRRVIKPQPYYVDFEPRYEKNTWAFWSDEVLKYRNGLIVRCPYGVPGDRLWVKEAWADPYDVRIPVYRADMATAYEGLRWRPSIFMPRWASRIILEITGVRAERVQAISEDDAIAEGVLGDEGPYDQGLPSMCFRTLWDSINAKRGFGWDVKPWWVWVIGFKRLEAK